LKQEILVTYIFLGSKQRLAKLKTPQSDGFEEFLFLNLTYKKKFNIELDNLILNSSGDVIVLLPPSSIPDKQSRKVLKKISMINISSWGWFELNSSDNSLKKKVMGLVNLLSGIPFLEQGIYFSKRLYFSIGGIGSSSNFVFKEISNKLLARIEPQKPLSSLIIRTKKISID
jgi:hypothetical protein